MKYRLAIFFTLLAAPVMAQTDVWTFNGPQQTFGTSTTFISTPSGLVVTASGFGPGGPVDVVQKNLGVAAEVGLGLANDPAGKNEISSGSFLQFNLLPGVNIDTVSLGTNSTTGGEQWGLSLSNTAGAMGSIFQSGTSNQTVNFQSGGAAFLDITELSGMSGAGVLVSELNEPSPSTIPPGSPIPPGIPEPSSVATLGAGLISLWVIMWLRRRWQIG